MVAYRLTRLYRLKSTDKNTERYLSFVPDNIDQNTQQPAQSRFPLHLENGEQVVDVKPKNSHRCQDQAQDDCPTRRYCNRVSSGMSLMTSIAGVRKNQFGALGGSIHGTRTAVTGTGERRWQEVGHASGAEKYHVIPIININVAGELKGTSEYSFLGYRAQHHCWRS
ncbi:hypothetical protein DL93DRAFT_513931 [Clavulina sp. PMI_390]|nr:hypothetical protein DL93DRAFT_513931 [Clavulina sp. PMI_390]